MISFELTRGIDKLNFNLKATKVCQCLQRKRNERQKKIENEKNIHRNK